MGEVGRFRGQCLVFALIGANSSAIHGGELRSVRSLQTRTSSRIPVPLAVLMLAACGGGIEENAGGGGQASMSEAPPALAGTVGTDGVGINPPTSGGSLVDSAAVSGPTDRLGYAHGALT